MSLTPPLRPLRIDPDALRLEPLELDAEDFQSPLPVQNHHLIFEDKTMGLAVGVWDTTAMQEAFSPYPGDEFITVLDGRFAILDAQGAAVTGEAGQSATFRNGIPVSWKQDGYLRKIYVTLNDPDGETPEIDSAEGGVRVLAADAATHGPPGPDGVICEALFRNDAGTMTVWRATFPEAGAPSAENPAHLLIRVLEGQITLTDADGRAEVFPPGRHVFLPRGARVAWKTTAGTSALLVKVMAS